MRIIIVLSILFSNILCAGSKGSIKLNQLSYPVSMSGYIYSNSEILDLKHDLIPVAHIEVKKYNWHMGYSYVQLNKIDNIVLEFNRKVKTSGAEGVVNFKIENSACILNHFYVLNFLPFWPGCSEVKLTGVAIVRK